MTDTVKRADVVRILRRRLKIWDGHPATEAIHQAISDINDLPSATPDVVRKNSNEDTASGDKG